MKSSRFLLGKITTALSLFCTMLMFSLSAATATPVKRIKVQFAPNVSSPLGAQIRTVFPAQLQAELDARPIDGFPDGASVIIRVENIQLSSDAFGGHIGRGSMASFDTVEGVALVNDARGNLIKRVPLIANSNPGHGMLSVADEPKRVVRLMETLAYWIPRQVHP